MRVIRRFAFLLLAAVVASNAWTADIRIVAPYVGSLGNVVEAENMDDQEGSGLFAGLYFQWVKPDVYQWNAFAYYAPDVNYSRVYGGHLIADVYVGPDWYGMFVVGAGADALSVDLDAGDAFGTDEFAMGTTVLAPYLRAGKYFKASVGPAELSLLPWAGIGPQWVWGDLDMTLSFPGPPFTLTVHESLDDYAFYGIAGVNLRATLFRFIDLEAKYQATFDGSEYLNTVNASAYLFLTRNWGLSYRFRYMESSGGSNVFHYGGVAFVF